MIYGVTNARFLTLTLKAGVTPFENTAKSK